MKTKTETPAIYVGTYAKYNNGSLFGEWVQLDLFNSISDFYNYCKELHKDEHDPEFMFQDWENIPDSCIGESYLNEDIFMYLNLDNDDKLKFNILSESTGYDFNYCLKHYEDVFFFEEGEEETVFFEMYPDLEKMIQNNYYLSVDIKSWLNDNYNEVTVNNTNYYVLMN